MELTTKQQDTLKSIAFWHEHMVVALVANDEPEMRRCLYWLAESARIGQQQFPTSMEVAA